MMNIIPVVLCGGSGSRLWPLSRAGFPKQFLVLYGKTSLFQQAVERVNTLGTPDICVGKTLVVTNEEHRFLALDQLREVETVSASLLLEPAGRNTAPALTLAAMQALEEGDDPILVVVPADQTVADEEAFTSAARRAVAAADAGAIVVLGVTPESAETGYGYVRANDSEKDEQDLPALTVEEFVEKPDLATAKRYLAEGSYYWNAGMFVLRASTWLKALVKFRPDIHQACEAAWSLRSTDAKFIRPGKEGFGSVPAESVDYAVIEHCPRSEFPIKMVPLSAGWSDLGAWDAVWNAAFKDTHGNAHMGDVVSVDSHNTLVHATTRLVSLVGVNDLVVVETPDAVLISSMSRSQEVKSVVATLNGQKREEHVLHRKVHRPWGWYDSIDEGGRFKVKRIHVKPKASLSLQMHHHRAEHWIVVSGTAEITCGDKLVLLSENQSTYIPLGETHRLANPGTIPLEIIEVQSGSYLGEDDIVRFEDTYGRTSAATFNG